ncbi:MAG: 2Fe-2S iron-sulfur cluster-binding protein [Acidobacteriota bacterium]
MSLRLSIDGRRVEVSPGATILDACRDRGIDVPTLCFLKVLRPANACRLCVVEVKGAGALVPACSRRVEAGMDILTDSERVRHSRKLILELLGSAVDLSLASGELKAWRERYEARRDRFGPPATRTEETGEGTDRPGHHRLPVVPAAETLAQPVRIDNDLYVRDGSRCVLCYRCVEACGEDAQNTYAITVAGRGFNTRIATEFDGTLPDSACVFCGNCIGVCPTGALMFKSEHDLRVGGRWDESAQKVTPTICPYCGVGCTLQLHVQANRIVKVTSPLDSGTTRGMLCVKGRFGWSYVQSRGEDPGGDR